MEVFCKDSALKIFATLTGKHFVDKRIAREGRGGEVSPALFWKLEESALNLENNVLITIIYGLSFSFKV